MQCSAQQGGSVPEHTEMTLIEIAIVSWSGTELPRAVAFGMRHYIWRFDLGPARIAECSDVIESTGEVSAESLALSKCFGLTTDIAAYSGVGFIIVAAPTPVDGASGPDLCALIGAIG
jgi:UDP-N-acetyl-D-mannosaminuronate dehydrogenase